MPGSGSRAALPLTIGATVNQLLRTKTGRLKRFVTITATAIVHWAAPDQDASRSFASLPGCEIARGNPKMQN